jgi:hypothetical protein
MMYYWCTTGSIWDGIYHWGEMVAYTFKTKCGKDIQSLDLRWRAYSTDQVYKCENCIHQELLEDLAK